MKKSSNFLRTSKDKLTKSFNSAKCKTSLKLASSRLKLMRNKKEVQVKQMKRELAQLLESGQNQSARIRVEHVVREEKMMAAYDLLEIYCELIVARLPIVESQKNCPIDLKEAITSVVFASPRCGDIPELVDVRKQFTVKYGKEFITAAVELRPDSGVSRLLVEKLSAKAPDGQTKLKILTAIAEEQGIKWDPKSFGESDLPPSDLLNGPNAFEKSSMVYEEPHRYESQDVRTPTTYNQVSNESLNASEHKSGSSMTTQSFASAQGGTSGTVLSSSSQPERRLSGFRSGRTEVGQSFPVNDNLSAGGQNWNMKFKDATSAAQAAAESAERASMAARAAAELSRMTGQYQTESQRSPVSIERDEHQGYSGASTRKAEKHHQDFPNGSFNDRNSRLQDEVGGAENDNMMRASRKFYHDGGDSGRSSDSVASPRSEIPIDNDVLRSYQEPDRSSEKNLSKDEHNQVKEVANKHSREFEPQRTSDYEEDINYFGEERTTVEVNNVPSASHSSTSRYGDSSQNHKFRYDDGNDPFVNAEEGHFNRNMKTSSFDVASAVFDKSSSDDDADIHFHTEPTYDDQQSNFYFPSPERKSPTHPSITGDYWSPRLNTSKMPENSALTSQIFVERHSPPESPKNSVEEAFGEKPQAAFVHATFDESDGMESETEDIDQSELITKHSKTHGSRSSEVGGTERKILSHASNEKDSTNDNRKGDDANDESLYFSSIDDAKHLKSSHSRLSVADGAKDNFNLSHSTGAWTDDDDKSTQSNSDYGNELNFGMLRGGLRHKGYITPPYTRAHQNDAPSSVNKTEEASATRSQITASRSVVSSVHSGSMKKENKSSSRMQTSHFDWDSDSSDEKLPQQILSDKRKPGVKKPIREVETKPTSHFDWDSDSSDEELPQQILSDKRKPDVKKPSREVETKPSSRGSATYFDSTDSEVDSPKQPNVNRNRLGSQFSRRTKVSPPKSETSGSSVQRKSAQNPSDARMHELKKDTKYLSNEALETKKPTRYSFATEAQEPQNDTGRSYDAGKQGIPSQQETSGQWVYHEQHGLGKSVSKSKPYLDEERRKTSTTEQPSSSDRKTQSSSNTEASKTSGSSGITLAREESTKKPSHVHPKLPEYDTIAAQLQSLRMNRK